MQGTAVRRVCLLLIVLLLGMAGGCTPAASPALPSGQGVAGSTVLPNSATPSSQQPVTVSPIPGDSPKERQPGAGQRSITPSAASKSAPSDGTQVLGLTTNLTDYPQQQVPRYEKFELTFAADTRYANPYDPAVVQVDGIFTAPDHSTLIQPGFYYQGYTVTMESDSGAETYPPIAGPVWKIRFAPRQAGVYRYAVRVKDSRGVTTSGTGEFQSIDTGEAGFVRVSEQNSRYFGFDNGRPFIGVGLNVGWWQDERQRISTYTYYLDRMHTYGANLARVWMTNSGKDQIWILSIQDKRLGADYNLEEAWAFDHILDLAWRDGVYFILTLDDVNQYTYNWPTNLYNSSLQGPCAYPACIFTSTQVKAYQQQLYRYLVARWGYSTNILSWELFNEIDELQWSTTHWDWCRMVGWHQEMGQYLQSIGAHPHLVNSSTGSFKTYGGTCGGAGSAPNLYAAPEMAFAQIHFYYVPGCCDYAPSDPAGRDMASLMQYYANLVYNSVSGKPSIIGEWGLTGANWSRSTDLAADTQGIHLHNGLWASAMSGMAAAGLNWHWSDHRAHDPAWWQHYRGIANYLAGIDIAGLTVLKPLNTSVGRASSSDDRPDAFASTNQSLRVMGLRNPHAIYTWVQNTQHTWWNVVHGQKIAPQSGTITIYSLQPDTRYTVTRWDTYAGVIERSETLTSGADGSLQIAVLDLAGDVALEVRLEP